MQRDIRVRIVYACMQMPSSNWLQLMQLSHLSRRDELQRSEGDLEIGSVGLEIVQSTGDVLLQLGGVLPRRAVGGDLVQRRGRHGGCCYYSLDDGILDVVVGVSWPVGYGKGKR